MPTIVDSLIVSLVLDPSGFSEGQAQAAETLRRMEQTSARSAETINRTSGKSIRDFLTGFDVQFKAVNKNLADLQSQTRRSGAAIHAGAMEGAVGLTALMTAGLGAYAALKSLQGIVGAATAGSSATGALVRTANLIGLDPRQLSTLTQTGQAFGVSPEQTLGEIANLATAQQLIPTMGPSQQLLNLQRLFGIDFNAPPEQIIAQLERHSTEKDFLAKLQQTGLSSLSYLRFGPDAARVRREAERFGPSDAELKNIEELNRKLNEFQLAWNRLTQKFQADLSTGSLGGVLTWGKDFINELGQSEAGVHALTVGAEVLTVVIGTTLVSAFLRLIYVMNAWWATPAMAFLRGLGLVGAAGGAIAGGAAAGAAGLFAPDSMLTPEQQEQRGGIFDRVRRWINRNITGAKEGEEKLPGGGGQQGAATPGTARDPRGVESALRASAVKHGLNPDDVVRVARGEGLGAANYATWDVNNWSYGAMQMHKGGLADEYQKATGKDPTDPKNEIDMNDWALGYAARHGWGKWTSVTSGRVPTPRRQASPSVAAGSDEERRNQVLAREAAANAAARKAQGLPPMSGAPQATAFSLIRGANAASSVSSADNRISNDINATVHVHPSPGMSAAEVAGMVPAAIKNEMTVNAINTGLE